MALRMAASRTLRARLGLRCIALAIAISVDYSLANGAQLNARVVLDKCIQSQLRTDAIEYDGVTESNSTSFNGKQSHARIDYHFRRNGTLADVSFRQVARRRNLEHVIQHRQTYGEAYKVVYQFVPGKEANAPKGAAWHNGIDREFDELLNCNNLFATALDGYVHAGAGHRLTQYLMKSTDLQIDERDSPDSQMIEIRGSTSFGHVTMKLDPDHGHLPSSIAVVKFPKDILCMELRLSDSEVDRRLHPQTLSEWKGDLSDIVFTQVNDTWVPISGTLRITQRFSGGATTTNVFSYHRDKLRLQPHFGDNAFVTDLQKGTRITYMDDVDSGVQYMWDGSNVVAAYSQPSGTAVGAWNNAASKWRVLTVALNLTAICGLGVWLYMRSRRAPKLSK
jgi:hypothetical protein